MTDRLPPHSDQCERGILSCLITNPEMHFGEVMAALYDGPIMFYDLKHQRIYEAMLAMDLEDKPIEPVAIRNELGKRHKDEFDWFQYIVSLMDAGSSLGLRYYLDTVIQKYGLRRVVSVCAKFSEQAFVQNADVTGLLDNMETDLNRVRNRNHESSVSSIQAVTGFGDDLDRRMAGQGTRSGIVTGLADLDEITDGLQFGEQFIIGARPSIGKTAIGLNIFKRACLMDGVPAVFISLEQSYTALMRRLAASWCHINMRHLKRGQLTDVEVAKLHEFNTMYRNAPATIYDFVDGGASAATISSVIKRTARKGVKLVVIDYLQKVRPNEKHEKRTYEVGETSGILRAAAVSCKVAMVTLAQLNREPEKEKGRMPRLSDLADSGQIERDADMVGLLHRDRAEAAGPACLGIAKQRDGETGIVNLHFDGRYCEFTNGTNEEYAV